MGIVWVIVFMNCLLLLIRWFVGKISSIVLGLCVSVCMVFRVMVGVVLCVYGLSRIVVLFILFCSSCLVVRKWWFLLVIMIGVCIVGRCCVCVIVCWKSVLWLVRVRNCLGRLCCDIGYRCVLLLLLRMRGINMGFIFWRCYC